MTRYRSRRAASRSLVSWGAVVAIVSSMAAGSQDANQSADDNSRKLNDPGAAMISVPS